MPLQAPRMSTEPTASRPGDPFWGLCAAALDGDQRAFTELHDRLSGGLRNLFLRRTGGREDLAEDLAQRTWAGFWKSATEGKYDPSRSAVSTFLYAVGTKIWLQHLRATRRADRRVAEYTPPAGADPQKPIDVARTAELLSAVRECLKDDSVLSEQERSIVIAAANGESDRTLARKLGIAPSTLNTRKKAAHEKLRRHLGRLGHRGDERFGTERQGMEGE
jgi:RNA polymerase sigma factor (sigma-70 family)